MIAPAKVNDFGGRKRIIMVWVAGLIAALLIGVYAVSDLRSSQQPPVPAINPVRR